MRPRARFVAYGLLGWCAEVAYTGLAGIHRDGDRALPAHTSLWMFPVYGLLLPLYEPLHDRLDGRAPAPVRGLAYGLGFMTIEYASGRLIRRLAGTAPWDYSGARWNAGGLVRADYLPLWAAAGLAMERVHEALREG